MRNSFPSVGPIVDDQPVAALFEFQLTGDFLSGCQKMAENKMVLRGDGGMTGMVLFGNQQNVNGRLGRNIPKGEDMLVLIHEIGFSLAVDDPFEDRFGHRPSLATRWSVRGAGG